MENAAKNNQLFKSPGLFFILGSPRSGTTLLRTLFDAHPNVNIPLEYPLIPLLYPKYKNKKSFSQNDIRAFIDDLKKPIKFVFWDINRWRIDWKQFEIDALAQSEIDFASLCTLLNRSFKSCFNKEEIMMIGDKNPIYSEHALLLVKLYPDAKFIHLSRDPRGQIASLQRQHFGNRLTPANAFRWNHHQKLAWRCRNFVCSNLIDIKYEDFIAEPEETLMLLCQFIGIPYKREVFDYYQESQKYLSEYEGDQFIDALNSTLQPIDKNKAEEWKTILKPMDIRIIESLCRRRMKILGYRRVYKESFWPWLLMIPVWLHLSIQFMIRWPILLLPFNVRTKIILRSSIFEKAYESLYLLFAKKKSRNQ